MTSVTIDVDVDLVMFETSDLIKEIKSRKEMPFGNIYFEEFILDCRRAFEKKDKVEFDYLMSKLEKEAGL